MPCEQVNCRDARSMSCRQNFRSFPSNFFMQSFQYFQIVNLVDCLSSWYKFIMNNPSNNKKSQQHSFYFWFGTTEFFLVGNWQSSIAKFTASSLGCIGRPMFHHLWWHGPKCHLVSQKDLGKLWLFFAFLLWWATLGPFLHTTSSCQDLQLRFS